MAGQSDVSEMFYHLTQAELKQSHEQINPMLSAFFVLMHLRQVTNRKRHGEVALIPDHLM